MKKFDIGQTIGILANIGVIAGIVFLALELRQNNELLVHDAQRSRAQSFRENMGVMAENAEIYVKDLNGETTHSCRISGGFKRHTSSYRVQR